MPGADELSPATRPRTTVVHTAVETDDDRLSDGLLEEAARSSLRPRSVECRGRAVDEPWARSAPRRWAQQLRLPPSQRRRAVTSGPNRLALLDDAACQLGLAVDAHCTREAE